MGFFVLCAQGQVFITFGDGFVIHWDAATGADRNITIRTRENAADVRVAEGHQSPIISLDVSLDGSRLLSADTSGRVILWRIGEPAEAALPEPRQVVFGDYLLVQNLVAGTTLYVQQDNELTFADPAIKGPFTVQDSSFRLTNVLAGTDRHCLCSFTVHWSAGNRYSNFRMLILSVGCGWMTVLSAT